LATLKGDAAKIKEKIAAEKEKNAAKVQELFKMKNDHPAEVSALICCFQIVNTEFYFLQAAPEIKPIVEVKMGPFASFNEWSVASAIQKSIVPWSIAMFRFGYPKLQTIKTYREMMIAIINAEQLLPGHPDCTKEARAYPVAFNDLLRKVKHAAGIY
jgi:hypothetical protein